MKNHSNQNQEPKDLLHIKLEGFLEQLAVVLAEKIKEKTTVNIQLNNTQSQNNNNTVLNSKEAAKYIGKSPRTLAKLRAEGKINYIQDVERGKLTYLPKDLDNFLNQFKVESIIK